MSPRRGSKNGKEREALAHGDKVQILQRLEILQGKLRDVDPEEIPLVVEEIEDIKAMLCAPTENIRYVSTYPLSH